MDSSVSPTYIDQCVPPFPKITVCDYSDRIAKLILYVWWRGNHKPNKGLLDCSDLILWKFVIAPLILYLTY